MTRFHPLAILLLAAAAPVAAQSWQPAAQPGYVNPFAPPSDADLLAQQLRLLAASPTDLTLLLKTARLSLNVGDTDSAAALYTRADRVSPGHPLVKAGMARLLVQAGRPGEALRRFQEAQAAGASERDFGPDRALAYDLVGEQERAQREYRALLRQGPDDETTRRYALSLGISGLKEPALALLEPLNRRSDRGAWRTRAFVLAMTGDRPGAEQIATTMMPPGMAQGLAPFFDRLPRLSAVERAFAVHFGETRPSPNRFTDARLVPPLPALAPEPNPFPPAARAPVQLAAREDDRGRRNRRGRNQSAEPVRLAAVPIQSVLPPPPAPTAAQLASLSNARPIGGFGGRGRVTVLPPPADAYRPTPRLAAAPPGPTASTRADEPDFAVAAVASLAGGAAAVPAATPTSAPPVALAMTRPVLVAATPVAAVPVRSGPSIFAGVPGAQVSTFTLAGPAVAPRPVAASIATVENAPAPPQPAPASVAAVSQATGTPPAPAGEDGDAVLAAIVAGITVPASELAPPPPVAPTVAMPPPASRSRLLANVEKAEAVEQAKADPRPDPKAKADAKAKDAKAEAKPRDAKGKDLADAKKPDPKKPDAKKPDPAKAEPERFWVQVAGGANEATLAKEWGRVSASTPSLKGKQGWTTPLRATNRVLTGPFKTSAEAMTLVNSLKKDGVAAFMFTSDAGQKVTRLGGK